MPKDRTIADIVAEMSAGTSARSDHDWKAAEKAARDGRVNEQVEVAKAVARATLDEQARRNAAWVNKNMGSLTPQEFRNLCREWGFDPGV
jgi:hypothetical protein